MLHINYIRSLDELEAMKSIWNQLKSNNKNATIFQSWEWNHIWCKYVLPTYKNANLKIIVLENENKETLGILPVFEDSLAGPFVKLFQFIGHHVSCQNDIILAQPENKELVEEVIATLQNELGLNAFLFLKHLDSNSLFTKNLADKRLAEVQYPRIIINNDPEIKDQRTRLRKSTRKNFRWRENKLKRDYEIRYSIKSGEEALPALSGLIQLHQNRFKSTNRETFVTGPVIKFFENCTLKMHDKIELIELYANDKVIASELAIHDNGQYFFMVGGFDTDFQEFSPLRILMTECMRLAFEEYNCEFCDLGPGYETYKYDWNPDILSNYFASISGPGPYSKILANLYKRAFIKRLPPDPRQNLNKK